MNGHQPTPLKVLIEFTFSKNWGIIWIISNQKISKKPIHPTIIYPHLYQPVQLEASVPIDLSTGEPRKIPPGVSIGKPVNNGRNLQYNINWVLKRPGMYINWDIYIYLPHVISQLVFFSRISEPSNLFLKKIRAVYLQLPPSNQKGLMVWCASGPVQKWPKSRASIRCAYPCTTQTTLEMPRVGKYRKVIHQHCNQLVFWTRTSKHSLTCWKNQT